MTINYGPYEPPPPTEPPPVSVQPAGPPPEQPSASPAPAAGVLLALLGFGALVVGLFALPIQKYGPSTTNDVYFADVRRLVAASSLPGVTSALGRIWWGPGLLAAVCVLGLLAAAMCVADSPPVRRPLGLAAAVVSTGTGVVHVLAMAQTADFVSVAEAYSPSRTLFHASGIGPWIAFMGFAATAIAGLITALIAPRSR